MRSRQSSRAFDDECERLLQQNSEEVREVHVREYHVPREERWAANRLAAALKKSTNVRSLFLQLDVLSGDLTSLLEYLGNPTTGLEKATIYMPYGHNQFSTSDAALKIIPTVANNASVREISLNVDGCHVSSMVHFRLLLQPSQTEVISLTCSVDIDADDLLSLDGLARSFASNRALKRLRLIISGKDAEHFTKKITSALHGHASLEHFHVGLFGSNFSAELASKIGSVVASSSRLKSLSLENCKWDSSNFGPVAASIGQSDRITEITLTRCTFDEPSTSLLRSIFYTSLGRLRLQLSGPVYFMHTSSFIYHLVESAPALYALDIRNICGSEELHQGLFNALQSPSSAVQKVQFGYLDYYNSGRVDAFLRRIPKCSLKQIGFNIFENSASRKAEVIEAFDQNESIIDSSDVVASFFGHEDRLKLEKISRRNDKLPRLIASQPCAGLPVGLWPHMFKYAQSHPTGLTHSFNGILTLLQQSHLPSGGKRLREGKFHSEASSRKAQQKATRLDIP